MYLFWRVNCGKCVSYDLYLSTKLTSLIFFYIIKSTILKYTLLINNSIPNEIDFIQNTRTFFGLVILSEHCRIIIHKFVHCRQETIISQDPHIAKSLKSHTSKSQPSFPTFAHLLSLLLCGKERGQVTPFLMTRAPYDFTRRDLRAAKCLGYDCILNHSFGMVSAKTHVKW